MKDGQNETAVYSYYPGCTLKTKGRNLDYYGRACGELLSFRLEEITQWQCCGGVYPMARDEIAPRLASVRALNEAKVKNRPLVTVCSACHHVIKRVNDDMAAEADISRKVHHYLELSPAYQGETPVYHYLELLRDIVTFAKLKEKVVKPLAGRKIGAYYGCLLLRPGSIMNFDDPENPTIMEELIRALGGTPVIYPYRNECCGGYISLKEKALADELSGKILADARHNGAEELITSCPLCQYSLTRSRQNGGIPVRYFTEVLAEALGIIEGGEKE